MSPAPAISVLTPVYDTDPDVLAECLGSVAAQTFTDWEHVLVDDASPGAHVWPQLLALAAPASLLTAAHAALADEIEHARVAFAVASALHGRPVGPGCLPEALAAVKDQIAKQLAA